ncbi:unnamed protein product, partial [Chrysoparadoxa australica]
IPTLNYIEERTQVPKHIQVYIVVASLGLSLFTGYGASFLCNLVGFLYPAYSSFKSLERTPGLEGKAAKEEHTQWLTYWLIFSTLSLLETFVEYLLKFIPFYYTFKLLFLVWCFFPEYHGALV